MDDVAKDSSQNKAYKSICWQIFTAICDTFYHLPTKLWEGNVFTAICLFMGKEFRVIIIRDALDLTVQSPPPPYPSSLSC